MMKKKIHVAIPKLAISLECQKQTEAAPSRQSAIATLRRENLIRLIIFSDSLAIRPLINYCHYDKRTIIAREQLFHVLVSCHINP